MSPEDLGGWDWGEWGSYFLWQWIRMRMRMMMMMMVILKAIVVVIYLDWLCCGGGFSTNPHRRP
jgi:hypothetical protein